MLPQLLLLQLLVDGRLDGWRDGWMDGYLLLLPIRSTERHLMCVTVTARVWYRAWWVSTIR
jgi:hypothetical protein